MDRKSRFKHVHFFFENNVYTVNNTRGLKKILTGNNDISLGTDVLPATAPFWVLPCSSEPVTITSGLVDKLDRREAPSASHGFFVFSDPGESAPP